MGSQINYPAGQRYERNKAQEGNTFVIPESDLQNADSTSFFDFHSSDGECNVAATSRSSSTPPERRDAYRCWVGVRLKQHAGVRAVARLHSRYLFVSIAPADCAKNVTKFCPPEQRLAGKPIRMSFEFDNSSHAGQRVQSEC